MKTLLLAAAALLITAAPASATSFTFAAQDGAPSRVEVSSSGTLEVRRDGALLGSSPTGEVDVSELRSGDVASLVSGGSVIATAMYDGLPTFNLDACLGNASFHVERAPDALILEAGAYRVFGAEVRYALSNWTSEQTAAVLLDRPLAAGDVAYAETYAYRNGIEIYTTRGRVVRTCYTPPTRVEPTGDQLPQPPVVVPPAPTTPTSGQTQKAVAAALTVTAAKLRTYTPKELAGRATVALPFAFPEPGALELQLVAGGKVIGQGTLTAIANGKGIVRVSLTAAGRKQLKRAKRIKLTVKAAFTPSRAGGTRQPATTSLTLKRK